MLVLAGSSGHDTWAALHLLHALSRGFPASTLTLAAPAGETDLASLLERPPSVLPYDARGRAPAAPGADEQDIVFLVSERDDAPAARLLSMYPDSVRISHRPEPRANMIMDLSSSPNPGRMRILAGILGCGPDGDWRPAVLKSDMERAAALISPVSNRLLPYMAVTGRVLDLLSRRGSELPLRAVRLDGSRNPLEREPACVRAAALAGASVVATDDPLHWVQARAIGIPVAGLDRRGRFPDWGGSPARGDRAFLERWEELLRTGW
jgi:hypothetical protein